jgi:hypothetical protein
MTMRPLPQAPFLNEKPMARQILIVVGAALLSVLGFALVLGIGYITLHLVLGDSPYTLESRIHNMRGVLSALFALVAIVGGGCAASALASQHERESRARNLSAPKVRS